MMTELKVIKLKEFEKDLKKLEKRFRTIEEDLSNLIDFQLKLYHLKGIDNKGIFKIPGLGLDPLSFYKVKKFACRSLKNKGARTGLRLIYTYIESENKIELIEIYFKQDKENEDHDRIMRLYKKSN